MNERFRPLILAAVGASAAVALLVGCTSSGDGGAGAIDDALQQGATLSAGSRPSGSTVDRVWLAQASSTREVLCVDVIVGETSDLFAVAFQLEYDASLMAFRGSTPGTFLGSASETLVQVDATEGGASGLGVVTVGVSRTAGLGGVTGCSSASDCGDARGPLITLCWDLLGPGTSDLTFTGNLGGFPPDSTDPADRVIVDQDFHSTSVSIE